MLREAALLIILLFTTSVAEAWVKDSVTFPSMQLHNFPTLTSD